MSRRTVEQEGLVDEIGAWLERGLDDAKVYLASPEGQELRRRIAQVLIFGAPLLFRMKFFRATPVGRVLGVVGGAALVVKAAQIFRDWEPQPGPRYTRTEGR